MNQAATFNVGTQAANYTTGDLLGTYSGVNLWLSEDEDGQPIILGYKSNPWSNTGRVLDIVNPFGTVAMASDILAALRQTNGIALNRDRPSMTFTQKRSIQTTNTTLVIIITAHQVCNGGSWL